MAFLSRKLLFWLSLAIPLTFSAQIPFISSHNSGPPLGSARGESIHDWAFDQKPHPNTTDHLVFDTVNTFLQHWTNTRYRSGHNLVLGTVPIGTLLYHGTFAGQIPKAPDWVAMDPEHSFLFCHNLKDGEGCWHLTLVTTRPLKVLYFDGSSAAKMPGGSMDSQDLIIWGSAHDDRLFNERDRINKLCAWGVKRGLDGFVRMEMDFEIMLCDFFSDRVEVVAFTQHPPPSRSIGGPPPNGPPPRQDSEREHSNTWATRPTPPDAPTNRTLPPLLFSQEFRVIESGAWHDNFPGDTRIQLDYSRILSFWDTSIFPSLVEERSGHNRSDFRAGDMTTDEAQSIKSHLEALIEQGPGSGVDWKTLFHVIHDRYQDRLQVLEHLFSNATEGLKGEEVLEEDVAQLVAEKAMRQLRAMIPTYILLSTKPPQSENGSSFNGQHDWATPVWRLCATTHTSFLRSPKVYSRLMSPERLLLQSAEGVLKEICRVVVSIWAEGEERGIQLVSDPDEALSGSNGVYKKDGELPIQNVIADWHIRILELMAWLDWSGWVKCRPACTDEEYCYLPTWPFFYPRPERGRRPPIEAFRRPQPQCVRRVEPFSRLRE